MGVSCLVQWRPSSFVLEIETDSSLGFHQILDRSQVAIAGCSVKLGSGHGGILHIGLSGKDFQGKLEFQNFKQVAKVPELQGIFDFMLVAKHL